MNKFLRNSFIIIVILFFFHISKSAIAQQPKDNCETSSLKLDMVKNEFKSKDSTQYLILIARLGKEEQNTFLNKRRLYAVKKYLITLGIQEEKIIIAQADKSDDVGKIEIYIEGQIVEAVFAKKNTDIPVGSCDNEKEDMRKFQLRQKAGNKHLRGGQTSGAAIYFIRCDRRHLIG